MYEHEYEERKERAVKPSAPVVVPSPNWSLDEMMDAYVRYRGLSANLARENGWYPYYDENRCPRILMPAQSEINTWPYYQARAMIESPKRYVSPSCPRGDALIVVYPPLNTDYGVVLVEGPMDALAAAGEGYVGISTMGATPNELIVNHIVHLARAYPKRLVVPDSDAIWEGATFRVTKTWRKCQKSSGKDYWANRAESTERNFNG